MDESLSNALRLTADDDSTGSISLVICDRAGNLTRGAGICIEVGSHRLLATAGHIVAAMSDDRLQLIPAGELSALPVPFASRSCGPDRPAPTTDVSWIELDGQVARDHPLRFLKLSDLKPKQTFERDDPFLVHGYTHVTAILSSPEMDLESMIGLTRIAAPEELPRAAESYEIALEYPPWDEQGRPIATAAAAFGFSGGGVWRIPRPDESTTESPERPQLVAINPRWARGTATLFATRIEYWLDLVRQGFPDARDEIDKLLG